MIYNSKADDNNMVRLCEAFTSVSDPKYTLKYTSETCEHDADVFLDGKLVAMLEAKQRTTHFTKFPTYIISSAKLEYLRYVQEKFQVPTYLVVGWTDRVGYTEIRSKYREAEGGRWDRGNPNDIETMSHIPLTHFTMVK